jgi:hypothetical protein
MIQAHPYTHRTHLWIEAQIVTVPNSRLQAKLPTARYASLRMTAV